MLHEDYGFLALPPNVKLVKMGGKKILVSTPGKFLAQRVYSEWFRVRERPLTDVAQARGR